MKKYLSTLIPSICFFSSYCQQNNLPLNREWGLNSDKNRNSIEDNSSNEGLRKEKKNNADYLNSSCFKPFISYAENIKISSSKSLFIRKLKKENLLIINDTADKFHLTIDPLFNFEYGKEYADSSKNFYKNTRGILVRGEIGKKFSFESSFYENQATFVRYIRDFNESFLVVPGEGRWKRFKKEGYDFAMASGYISYSPNHHFNFQLGTGKHFVGDGYRSLLLSDNAFNYPFARITTSFGKFQYTNLYTSFMNLSDGGVKTPPGTEKLFQKKAGSFQFLNLPIRNRIQIGFFQGLIWQSADSTNNTNLHLPYANPVIFANALQYGLKNKNNILLGATIKIKITNSISTYGQYMLDEIEKDFIKNSLHNKQGYQIGVKYFDVLGLKNLHLQIEYNKVRPYSYSSEKSSQSYSHYNQPLAHPLGANFSEIIAFLNYRTGNFFTEIKFNYAVIGKDSIEKNYGNNILNSNTNSIYGINSTINKMGQGVSTTLKIIDAHIGYLINPSTNFNIVVGISNRFSINSTDSQSTNFLYFSCRTSLSNHYYDF